MQPNKNLGDILTRVRATTPRMYAETNSEFLGRTYALAIVQYNTIFPYQPRTPPFRKADNYHDNGRPTRLKRVKER